MATETRRPDRSARVVLPEPTAAAWDWQLTARCRQMEQELFFPSSGEHAGSVRTQVLHAKRICSACPVLAPCRTYAIEAGETHGIWGGMTALERARHRRRSSSRPADA
ncbi:WhiB family transcriptional regulator [Nocardia fluminea]|uniref:WhiB family transcriptional regulator n=1 Tax=Nocardia fluminea TaxID=134984 RepID=UPI0037F9898E